MTWTSWYCYCTYTFFCIKCLSDCWSPHRHSFWVYFFNLKQHHSHLRIFSPREIVPKHFTPTWQKNHSKWWQWLLAGFPRSPELMWFCTSASTTIFRTLAQCTPTGRGTCKLQKWFGDQRDNPWAGRNPSDITQAIICCKIRMCVLLLSYSCIVILATAENPLCWLSGAW